MSLEDQLSILLRLVVAAALAAVIGYDREKKQRPAGMRTHMLVGLSAALLVSLSEAALLASRGFENAQVDSLRVLEAIVAGVSFIGAGTIFRSGSDVRGITTAGSLLGVAALGAAVGFGLYLLAIATTILLLVILRVVRLLEPSHERAP